MRSTIIICLSWSRVGKNILPYIAAFHIKRVLIWILLGWPCRKSNDMDIYELQLYWYCYCHVLLSCNYIDIVIATSGEYWYGYCRDGHVGKVLIWILMSRNCIDIAIATSGEYWYGYCWYGHVGRVLIWILMSRNYIDMAYCHVGRVLIWILLVWPRRKSNDAILICREYWRGAVRNCLLFLLCVPRN